jgi:hypothetical protein
VLAVSELGTAARSALAAFCIDSTSGEMAVASLVTRLKWGTNRVTPLAIVGAPIIGVGVTVSVVPGISLLQPMQKMGSGETNVVLSSPSPASARVNAEIDVTSGWYVFSAV